MLKGSGIAIAAAWVTAVARIQSSAQELPHAAGSTIKKKESLNAKWQNTREPPDLSGENPHPGIPVIAMRYWHQAPQRSLADSFES